MVWKISGFLGLYVVVNGIIFSDIFLYRALECISILFFCFVYAWLYSSLWASVFFQKGFSRRFSFMFSPETIVQILLANLYGKLLVFCFGGQEFRCRYCFECVAFVIDVSFYFCVYLLNQNIHECPSSALCGLSYDFLINLQFVQCNSHHIPHR